ncbi:Nmad2 family putative nucleotide modification protein [Sphingobacterium siyangense]
MLKIYTYVLDHDLGLAPNPFWGYCTVAVCKPKIRKSKKLKIGDWIVGTGSRELEKRYKRPKGKYVNKLIYAMEVNEILTFEDYWNDIRFNIKKPVLDGSLAKMYGDNIYKPLDNSNWAQLNSAHSNADGSINKKHLKTDISGKNVLISTNFYYLGDKCVRIPDRFHGLIWNRQGEKSFEDGNTVNYIDWIINNHTKGVTGDPIDWVKHNQLIL